VLDEAVEEKAGGEKVRIGMVVRISSTPKEHFDRSLLRGCLLWGTWLLTVAAGEQVIRGNSVVMLEALERIGGDGGGGGQR